MSEENYSNLPNSFRKFKEKLVENNPELLNKNNAVQDPYHMKHIADQI